MTWEMLESGQGYLLERASVPGGWLYRSAVTDDAGGKFLNSSIAFVPDGTQQPSAVDQTPWKDAEAYTTAFNALFGKIGASVYAVSPSWAGKTLRERADALSHLGGKADAASDILGVLGTRALTIRDIADALCAANANMSRLADIRAALIYLKTYGIIVKQ